MMETRIGVLGGTFDPPHIGHLAGAEDAAAHLDLDHVLFVPNLQPPHKLGENVSDVRDRVAMAQLAVADNPRFSVSLIEMERRGPSYTVDTMRLLRERMAPDVRLFFLAGCDALNQLHGWHEPEQLLEEFEVAIMGRPIGDVVDWGAVERRFPRVREKITMVDVVELGVSSSDIRARVRDARPLRYYVPPAVERYVLEHCLFKR